LEEQEGARGVKRIIGERMRVVKEEGKQSWSWEREITAHFGNLSPSMRGSFRNPLPGSLVSTSPSPTATERGLRLGQQVNDLYDKVARSNFRVCIIMPDVVEQVDLTRAIKLRRTERRGSRVVEEGGALGREW